MKPNNMELTKQQIERQDFVDNAIYELLNDVCPTDKHLDWDIELIGNVRDAIQTQLVKRDLCSEQEFYPYLEC